jgi:hypothetical protein
VPVPPGWPREVPPPEAPDWERRAVAWLFDQAPGDWRGVPVLAKQPRILALSVSDHIAATRTGVRTTVAGLRAALAGSVPPMVAEEAVRAFLAEEARLDRVAREVALVTAAIERVN